MFRLRTVAFTRLCNRSAKE